MTWQAQWWGTDLGSHYMDALPHQVEGSWQLQKLSAVWVLTVGTGKRGPNAAPAPRVGTFLFKDTTTVFYLM